MQQMSLLALYIGLNHQATMMNQHRLVGALLYQVSRRIGSNRWNKTTLKQPSKFTVIAQRGRLICRHVLFCSRYGNKETSNRWKFHGFTHLHSFDFHETWLCPVCHQKAAAYFCLYNSASPSRYFQQVPEKENQGTPHGVLFLLFCLLDNKRPLN